MQKNNFKDTLGFILCCSDFSVFMLSYNNLIPAQREISPLQEAVTQNMLDYKMHSIFLHKPNGSYSLFCPLEVSAELKQTKQQGQGVFINLGQKQQPIENLTGS